MSNTVIVLGAAGGIGSALSRRLAANGHTVVAASRSSEPLERLSSEIGGVARTLDATMVDQVDALVE